MMSPRKDSHRDFLRSQGVIQRRKRKALFRLYLRIFLFVFLVGSLIYVSWLDQIAIHKVVVVGTDSGMASEIESEAEASLQGTYAWIIPRRNALFYPKASIRNQILSGHPRISSLGIKTEGFDILNVKVTEREAAMRWCSDSNCYLMDSNAFVYATDTDDGSNVANLITMYGGPLRSTSTDPIGLMAFDKAAFATMLNIGSDLASSSMTVETITYKDADTVSFKIQDNGQLILSSKKQPEESVGNVNAALKSSAFGTSTQFEYIDARFGNKVFYKAKSQYGILRPY